LKDVTVSLEKETLGLTKNEESNQVINIVRGARSDINGMINRIRKKEGTEFIFPGSDSFYMDIDKYL